MYHRNQMKQQKQNQNPPKKNDEVSQVSVAYASVAKTPFLAIHISRSNQSSAFLRSPGDATALLRTRSTREEPLT